ncbi:MAG: alpha-ribazole phosphatase [Thermoleophilia bacterium]|nr:alpha-ribazole phosphatase [Thermoleophilia bacterium]
MTPTDETTTIVHLVRHGQTILNVDVRFRGRRDVPLNDTGRREAIAAGHMLKDANLAAVYASPLTRAFEVGTAIAAASGLHEVIGLDNLVNVDYGRWEGLTSGESRDVDPVAWDKYCNDPDAAACPGGESLIAAGDRVVRALKEIHERNPGQSVAAVSHGVMLRLAVRRIWGNVEPDWQFKISTGGSLVFAVTGDDIKLVSDVPSEPRDEVVATHA